MCIRGGWGGVGLSMVLLVGLGLNGRSGLAWSGFNLGLICGTGLRNRVPVHVLKAYFNLVS